MVLSASCYGSFPSSARLRIQSTTISNQCDEIADGAMRFDRVPQRTLLQDSIVIPSPYFFSLDKAVMLEVCDDPLDSSLCDANLEGNLSQNHRRILCQ